MNEEVMVIFTGKSAESCLKVSGTQSWVLEPRHAKRCKYVVLCQNAYAEGEWADGREPHGTAFMIGRVSDVVPSTEVEGRWLVKFDEYARLDKPNFWKGWRNPVRYFKTLEELSLSIDELHFETVPIIEEPEKAEIKPLQASGKLTIAEAKKALAETFGVSPDAVEITIHG